MFFYNMIICCLSIAFWFYVIYAIWEYTHGRAPFVPTPKISKVLALKKISQIIEKTPDTKTVVDAGCGDGKLLAILAQKYPSHHFIGIEYSAGLYNYCIHRYPNIANLSFRHQDLLTFDYTKTDIIYYFGMPKLTNWFQEKLLKTQNKFDLIALDADFNKLKLEEKIPFKFWLTKSFLYHYKN